MRSTTARSLACIAALLLLGSTAGAEIKLLDGEQHSFGIYGFLKLDATYQDHEMNSLVAPRFPLPATPENDSESTGFTAMHSRLAVKWLGPEVFAGARISGCYEFDLFDGSSRNQMKVRTRLAFLELKSDTYSLIAGQDWDIFGGGQPKTLLTNGYYWNTGNLGFRRAQLRYTRFFSSGELAVSLADPTTRAAIDSGIPLLSSRYSHKVGAKGQIALSVVYGQEESGDETVDMMGISIDFKLPTSSGLSFIGELSTGENLKIMLSRAGARTDEMGHLKGLDVLSGWIEAVYSTKRFDTYVGFAGEQLRDDELLADGDLKTTTAIMLGFIHKLGKGFSYGFELTRFSGEYLGAETADANQLDLAVTYVF